ncbi:MAG: prepilin peptidase [bacterium]|nr:prepilin peptidase [bacterium]
MIEVFIQVVIFIAGALLGSFFNVCIYRLPIQESIIIPPSHCPNCKTRIKIWENIPILSYIILKGKCRSCEVKIPLRYLIVEILTPVLFLLLWHTYGYSYEFGIYLLFISILIIITFIDFEHQLILNIITYPMFFIGLLINFLKGTFFNSLIAGLIGGGIIFLIVVISPFIFKKEGMGGGDFKLAAVIGVFLANGQNTLISLFLASFLGSLVGVTLILLGKKKFGEYIPFGPYLTSGAVIVLFWGKNIMEWCVKRL